MTPIDQAFADYCEAKEKSGQQLTDAEALRLTQAFVTEVAAAHAERTYLAALEYMQVERTAEEFSEFLNDHGGRVIAAIQATWAHHGLPREGVIIDIEKEVGKAFVDRLDQLFSSSARGTA